MQDPRPFESLLEYSTSTLEVRQDSEHHDLVSLGK